MNTSQLHKASNVLQFIPVPMKCWSMMGVDLVGPLNENDGFHYNITAVDYTSKWVEGEPIRDKSALSVAQFSSNTCAGSYITYIDNINLRTKILMHELHVSNNFRYGACDNNINDQGKELNNQISSEFYQLVGMQHRITAAYHPQSNGLVKES